MSIKLHLATTGRDTERGLSSTPGTGTPRKDVSSPMVTRRTATSENEGVEETEEDLDSAKKAKKKIPKK